VYLRFSVDLVRLNGDPPGHIAVRLVVKGKGEIKGVITAAVHGVEGLTTVTFKNRKEFEKNCSFRELGALVGQEGEIQVLGQVTFFSSATR